MENVDTTTNIKIYRNNDVMKIIGLIPPNHKHLRLAIFLKDQTIVLHEATVAAIVRAYINITTHPIRKAVEYVRTIVNKNIKKSGYADDQFIETNKTEEEIIHEWCNLFMANSCNVEQNHSS